MENPGTDDVDDLVGPFDGHKAGDILHKEFGDSRIGVSTSPVDGLPMPVFDGDNLAAPPLTTETFVCMADESGFVIRDDFGYPLVRFEPEEVVRSPNGRHYVLFEQIPKEALPKLVTKIDRDYALPKTRIEVMPLRQRCSYLIEKVTGFEGGYERVVVNRMCGQARADNGDFMSLRDEMVIACMGRCPPDFVSEDRLRKLNNHTMALGAERVARGECYDVDQLDHLDEDELGGIFK
jgi:hypothetical protein